MNRVRKSINSMMVAGQHHRARQLILFHSRCKVASIEARNVWLGVTAENQTYFDQRWKRLQNIPALIKFISYEPALGPLRLAKHGPFPDWLISGGESGGGARQMDPQWVRDIIADCQNSGVAPFHKQWGTYKSNPLVTEQGMSVKDAKALDNHGKGGGLVDGKLIREFPLRVR